jgi:hypothetical protein
MKKILLLPILIAIMFIGKTATAQSDTKTFHFGLKVAPAVSWFNPDNKDFSSDGVQFGFGYGLITEFNFSDNYAFSTGLEVLNAGGKMAYPDSTLSFSLNEKQDTFILNTSTYRLRYVNLPLLLKLKTNQIGAMTYFGQFGFDVSFKWKGMADEDVTLKGTSSTLNDVDIAKDINFIRLALNVGLGAEYNLSGSTSLVFSVNYNNGFTNAMFKNSKMLTDEKFEDLQQKAVFNYVGLTVGVLF